MEIKKGNRFVCVKDLSFLEGSRVCYIKGNVYKSELDGCITNEQDNKEHAWVRDELINQFFIPYSKLDRVYTKYTERLYKMYLDFNGLSPNVESEIIGQKRNNVFFDNMSASAQTGFFGWNNDDKFSIDFGAVYLSEQEFIEFMGLGDVKDNVNKPSHYTQGSIEPIDYILANEMNFLEGNVIKYVTRYKHKNGLEDLKKAEFYLKKLIEEYGKV